MSPRFRDDDVANAADDLRRRTLSHFERPLDRLIYLASTRDYNTGIYYHDGLAAAFGEDAACQALAECHREAFRQVIGSSLRDLVQQVEEYIESVHLTRGAFVAAWQKLEPYRVTVPLESDPLAAEFFFGNLRTALAILDSRQQRRHSTAATA
jgi:hypothetical protein